MWGNCVVQSFLARKIFYYLKIIRKQNFSFVFYIRQERSNERVELTILNKFCKKKLRKCVTFWYYYLKLNRRVIKQIITLVAKQKQADKHTKCDL